MLTHPPSTSQSQQHSCAAWLRRARLWSGIVLVVYLTTHLANHALGLVSFAVLEAGRGWFLLLWRNPLGTTLLYGALASHLVLALWSLYQRPRLRMSLGEAVQLLLGLAIPPFLTTHVVGTRLAHAWFDVTDSYTAVVLGLWVLRPDVGVRQVLVVLLAWLHGCLGMYFWLRLQPWYRRVAPWLLAVAILLPALALLGFVQAGRDVAAHAREPGWLHEVLRATHALDAAARQRLDQVRTMVPGVFGAAVGAILLARAVRQCAERRRAACRSRPHGVSTPCTDGAQPHGAVGDLCGGGRPSHRRSARSRLVDQALLPWQTMTGSVPLFPEPGIPGPTSIQECAARAWVYQPLPVGWWALFCIEEMTARHPFLFPTAEWALGSGTLTSIPRYSKTKRRTMTPAPSAFRGRAARRHLPSGLATPRRRLSQRTRHLG